MLTKEELAKLEEVINLTRAFIMGSTEDLSHKIPQINLVGQAEMLLLREKRRLTQWETEKKLAVADLEAMDKTKLTESDKDGIIEGLLDTYIPDDVETLLILAASDLDVMEIESRIYEPSSSQFTLYMALCEDLSELLEERYDELVREAKDAN